MYLQLEFFLFMILIVGELMAMYLIISNISPNGFQLFLFLSFQTFDVNAIAIKKKRENQQEVDWVAKINQMKINNNERVPSLLSAHHVQYSRDLLQFLMYSHMYLHMKTVSWIL